MKRCTNLQEIEVAMQSNNQFKDYIDQTLSELRILEQTITAIMCYCREANLAWLMRKYVHEKTAIPKPLIARFESIMQIDIVNQEKGLVVDEKKQPTAIEMLNLFR